MVTPMDTTFTTPEQVSAPDTARRPWTQGLLVAAAAIYGSATVLLMAVPLVGPVAWGSLGAVAGLVALGFLASAVSRSMPHPTPRPPGHERDEWAELWEQRMQMPVQ